MLFRSPAPLAAVAPRFGLAAAYRIYCKTLLRPHLPRRNLYKNSLSLVFAPILIHHYVWHALRYQLAPQQHPSFFRLPKGFCFFLRVLYGTQKQPEHISSLFCYSRTITLPLYYLHSNSTPILYFALYINIPIWYKSTKKHRVEIYPMSLKQPLFLYALRLWLKCSAGALYLCGVMQDGSITTPKFTRTVLFIACIFRKTILRAFFSLFYHSPP